MLRVQQLYPFRQPQDCRGSATSPPAPSAQLLPSDQLCSILLLVKASSGSVASSCSGLNRAGSDQGFDFPAQALLSAGISCSSGQVSTARGCCQQGLLPVSNEHQGLGCRARTLLHLVCCTAGRSTQDRRLQPDQHGTASHGCHIWCKADEAPGSRLFFPGQCPRRTLPISCVWT